MCYNIRQVKMQILKLSQCSWTKRQKIKKCKTKQIIIPKCPTLERKNRDHRRDVIIINTKNHPRRDLLQLKYFSESLQNETPHNRASLVPQMEKTLPPMQKTWIWSLGWENPLDEGMAIHFSILAWIPMDRGPWWATVHGVTKSQTQLSDKAHNMSGSMTKRKTFRVISFWNLKAINQENILKTPSVEIKISSLKREQNTDCHQYYQPY